MKKKIELEIPNNILKDIKEGEPKYDLIKRRILGMANAIARRSNIDHFKENDVKVEGNKFYVETDLTADQIDKLPIGLKRLIK